MTATIEDWTRLCTLLDDDPELEPAVRRAAEADDSPWTALIDGLDDAGSLAYLDESDTGSELADALPPLPRIVRTGVGVDEVGDIDDLTAAIMRADELLAPHGLRTLCLHDEEDADAYPLLVVPSANVDEILVITAALGHRARIFG